MGIRLKSVKKDKIEDYRKVILWELEKDEHMRYIHVGQSFMKDNKLIIDSIEHA